MYLVQTVGPAAKPVSVADVKAAGRIDFADDDDLIGDFIDAAARAVGEYAGRVLVEETWALSVPAIVRHDLILPKSPVREVSSITYFDADDVQQTGTVANFYLMKGDDRAVLRPKSGEAWPTANTDRDDAITVTFVAGYETVPPTLAHAVKMMALHLYENREATTTDKTVEVPLGIQSLIGFERLGWVQA